MIKSIQVEVYGRKEAIELLSSVSDQGLKDVARAINACAMRIRNGAIKRVPTTGISGHLRASIHAKMYSNGMAATIGTNLKYAPFVEFGTAREGARTNRQLLPDWYRHGSDHKMPIKDGEVVRSLARWSKIHGLNPWAVALGIKRRGGVRARPYLWPSIEEERPKIAGEIANAVREGILARGRK